MALVVESGTGSATAESYNAIATVATWGDEHPRPASTDFDAGTDAQKEGWCREATLVLDGNWGARFPGSKKTSEQALLWPRNGAHDREGYLRSTTTIPAEITNAHAALSLLAATGELMPDQAASGAITHVAAGSVEVDFAIPISYSAQRLVDALLATLLEPFKMWRA